MKKKILIISPHSPSSVPSQRFRFEQYISFLEENNFQIIHSYVLKKRDAIIFYKKAHYFYKLYIVIKSFCIRFFDLLRTPFFDLIFIHRESFMLGGAFFERGIALLNKKIIYDIDDAIWLPNSSKNNQVFAFMKNPEKIKTIIKLSKTIIVGNGYLENYAREFNKNIVLIPTTINTTDYDKKTISYQEKKTICIGWIGSITTIAYFEYITPVLKKIKEIFKEDISFSLIGDSDYKNKELGIIGKKWSLKNEIKDISSFDIGIMPLPNNLWTRGKCGLKILQYMSLGIPVVASNVGVNGDIIENNTNGFLCKTEKEWIENISKLVKNKNLREEMGGKGKEEVEKNYSFEKHKKTYLKVIQKSLQ